MRHLGAWLLPLLLVTQSAHAALTISTTRIIYNGHQRSASVVVANPSKQHYAAQSWINTQADDTTTAVPFITTPALFRLNAGREQTVQINGLPNDLPQDRESLFFFNLQEVPQTDPQDANQNALRIALRTRIKFFYRPIPIAGSPSTRLHELEFSTLRDAGHHYLNVRNPTPYHYVFNRLELDSNASPHPIREAETIAPLQSQRYRIPNGLDTKNLNVTFTVINDYGGISAPSTLAVQDPT